MRGQSAILGIAVALCTLIASGGAQALQSPKGCEVSPLDYSQPGEFTDTEMDEWWAYYLNDIIAANGLIVETLSAPSAMYNCHGYTYVLSEGIDECYVIEWDNAYTGEIDMAYPGPCSPSYLPTTDADLIRKVRYEWNLIPHSGVVEWSGSIVSKWGLLPLVRHAVDQVPPQYGEVENYYGYADEVNPLGVERATERDGVVSWIVSEQRNIVQAYSVQREGLNGEWFTIGRISATGPGRYEYSIGSGLAGRLRLLEEVVEGGTAVSWSIIRARGEGQEGNVWVETQVLEEMLNVLNDMLGIGQRDDREKNLSVPECVVYTNGELEPFVTDYLARYWWEDRGIAVEVVDIAGLAGADIDQRDALRQSIRDHANAGVGKFHLVGDANEWQEYVANGYGEAVQPERDIVPTFYLYDDFTLNRGRPYYSTDWPYMDIDDDGLPDVVVTRWPVATPEELVSRIVKTIEYNKHRDPAAGYEAMAMLALVGDVDDAGNSGQLVAEAADAALAAIPTEANITVYRRNLSAFGDDYYANIYGAWSSLRPDVVSMWSTHSDEGSPNNFLSNEYSRVASTGEVHPVLVLAPGCFTAKFAENDFMWNGEPLFSPAEELHAGIIDRGSIAWIGSTIVTSEESNREFSREFLKTLFEVRDQTMAEAWLAALRGVVGAAGYNGSLRRRALCYTFLGDPLSRLEKRRPDPLVFEKITHYALAGADRNYNSAEWVDYDSDGELDLYLANGSMAATSRNQLIEVGYMAPVTDVTPQADGAGIDWLGDTIESAWADYDNDGDPDVYLVNSSEIAGGSNNVLFTNYTATSGLPVFSRVAEGDVAGLEDPAAEGSAEWIDLDGDGYLDLFVGRLNGFPLVFRGTVDAEGAIELRQQTVPGLTDLVLAGETAWCDYNLDGRIDLFAYGTSGACLLLGLPGFVWVTPSRS